MAVKRDYPIRIIPPVAFFLILSFFRADG